MTVINVSELDPEWNWLARRFNTLRFTWIHHTQLDQSVRFVILQRLLTAFKAAWEARTTQGDVLLVAHGPRMGVYTCLMASLLCRRVPILIYSFNYTELPRGWRRQLARWILPRAHHYVAFSTFEKSLYARYLGLPASRFEMLPWGVRPPPKETDCNQPPSSFSYICALGTQGRDYATLFKAMARIPHIQLVAVVHRESVANLDIPANVTIRTSIPLEEAQAILKNSRFMVLPLVHGQVPCGHVTTVLAMHHGKAMVCTDSVGLHDYAQRDHTALLCPAGDEVALAETIDRLWNDSTLAQALGQNGLRFVQKHCTEDAIVDWFRRYLETLPAAV